MHITKSEDGTIKMSYDEGYSAVIIPGKEGKNTLCVSSQVGCPLGCKFCISGEKGFVRNLEVKEIVGQFIDALQYLDADLAVRDTITAIVFMGMGEPLLNIRNLMDACDYLHTHYAYSYRRVSVSTAGIIPGMNDIYKWRNKVHLALSLHSPFQEIRDKIMPGVSKYTIEDLISYCHKYNKNRKEKIMIEYLMIEGLTDRDEDLQALLDFDLMELTNFNLIRLNGTIKVDGKEHKLSSMERCLEFKEKLMAAGYKCFIRDSRGIDIEAACGMLGMKDK